MNNVASSRPLSSLRVLDLSWLVPGPYASMLLADLGADVIKVEQPGRGDYLRELVPESFMMLNRNKRSVELDLKDPADRQSFLDLASTVDVILEGFRPGVVKRLGVDFETVVKFNPQIVYCSISGYGQDGDYAQWPGHDLSYLGMGGGLSVPGDVDAEPARSPLPMVDLASSGLAAVAILAAVTDARESGRGDYIDISMTDVVSSWSTTRLGNVLLRDEPPVIRATAFNRIYRGSCGRRFTLASIEDEFFAALCNALGLSDWLSDPAFADQDARVASSPEAIRRLDGIFSEHDRDHWVRTLSRQGVPVAPVLDPLEVYVSDYAQDRGMVRELEDGTRQFAFPAKFKRTSTEILRPPPSLGEHTREVLAELSGQTSLADPGPLQPSASPPRN